MSLRTAVVIAFLAILAGCSSPPAPPPQPITIIDPDAACLKELSATNAAFQAMPPFAEGQCSVVNPVKIAHGGADWNRPGILSCPMAKELVRFETEVIQPLARQYFGQGVTRINNLGTYDCRSKRNESTLAAAKLGTSKGGRLSEHAQGRAIDLAGVQLADGTQISVKNDWRAGGNKSAFLHALAKESCRRFNVVLTPNHDRFHQDRIHLDIGRHTLCGY